MGVLRILEARKWALPVERLLEIAFQTLPADLLAQRPGARQELAGFLRQRFAALLEERGYRFDEIDAVVGSGIGVLPQTLARLAALHEVRSKVEFGPLSAAFKRAGNIIRQADEKKFIFSGEIRDELLKEPCERALFEQIKTIHREMEAHVQSQSYQRALESMVVLREPLDQFFDGVMVMAEDQELRNNRLRLLDFLVRMFRQIADFSKLQNA